MLLGSCSGTKQFSLKFPLIIGGGLRAYPKVLSTVRYWNLQLRIVDDSWWWVGGGGSINSPAHLSAVGVGVGGGHLLIRWQVGSTRLNSNAPRGTQATPSAIGTLHQGHTGYHISDGDSTPGAHRPPHQRQGPYIRGTQATTSAIGTLHQGQTGHNISNRDPTPGTHRAHQR